MPFQPGGAWHAAGANQGRPIKAVGSRHSRMVASSRLMPTLRFGAACAVVGLFCADTFNFCGAEGAKFHLHRRQIHLFKTRFRANDSNCRLKDDGLAAHGLELLRGFFMVARLAQGAPPNRPLGRSQ